MPKNDAFKICKGKNLPFVGRPLLVLTIEEFPGVRRAIYFLLLATPTKEPTLRKKAFTISVPHSNELIFDYLERAAANELQIDIAEVSKAVGSEVAPAGFTYCFEQISPDEFGFQIVCDEMQSFFQQIRELTTCDSLKKSLPPTVNLINWRVTDDRQTFRD